MLTLTPHNGTTCPVPAEITVAYRLVGDPEIRTDRAGTLAWGLRDEPGRIESYAVLEFADTAVV